MAKMSCYDFLIPVKLQSVLEIYTTESRDYKLTPSRLLSHSTV